MTRGALRNSSGSSSYDSAKSGPTPPPLGSAMSGSRSLGTGSLDGGDRRKKRVTFYLESGCGLDSDQASDKASNDRAL